MTHRIIRIVVVGLVGSIGLFGILYSIYYMISVVNYTMYVHGFYLFDNVWPFQISMIAPTITDFPILSQIMIAGIILLAFAWGLNILLDN